MIKVYGISFRFSNQKQLWDYYNKFKKLLVGETIKDRLLYLKNHFDVLASFNGKKTETNVKLDLNTIFETKSHNDYNVYLKSKDWVLVRKIIINERKCCEICNSKNNLVIHHLKYKDVIFKELENKNWVMLVCRLCHQDIHFDKKYICIDPKRSKLTINRLEYKKLL